MNNFQKLFTEVVNSIQGNGTFCIHNEMNFIPPGLEIEGLGEIGLPLENGTAKKIIAISKKAPFGKGSKTILDESIRNTWELDPHSFKLNNSDWGKFIEKLLIKVGEGLGLENSNISSSLYKLLLYEKDSFFKKHKDSEKEDGMFGTLTICLPSTFEGGELNVYFDGKQTTIDFSKTSKYKISFAAFYADCDHEIKPISSGFKLSLVYNLIIDKSFDNIKLAKNSYYVNQISELLKSNIDEFNSKPKVYLLDHQYTPANFGESTLKLRDKQIVQTLCEAAKNAGYYAKLCLLTHYKTGALESDDDYYRNYSINGSETSDGTMGEVYEEYSSLESWANDNTPSLGQLREENIEIFNPIIYDEQDPIEEEAEGYTGNAGMTIDYWYHFGAIVLYPLSKIDKILEDKPDEQVILEWLNYIFENEKFDNLYFIESLVSLLVNSNSSFCQEKLDYSSLATILAQIKNAPLFTIGNPVLINKFEQISTNAWINLFTHLPIQNRIEIISKAIERKNSNVVNKYLTILDLSLHTEHKLCVEILVPHFKTVLETYSTIFSKKDKSETNQIKSKIIEQSIVILSVLKSDELEDILFKVLNENVNRDFAHNIAAPALLNLKENKLDFSNLPDEQWQVQSQARKLVEICLTELEKNISNKPQPPSDWQRAIPKENKKGKIWDILIPFLESPTLEKIEYKRAKAYRDEMENGIRNAPVDLDTQTIKKGTPYTLLIIKNEATYKKLFEKWSKDCELKNVINRLL